MFYCSHGHAASWLTATVQITAFMFGGIFLKLSITWPESMLLSPLPAHQHCRISPVVRFKPQQQTNKAHLAVPWSLSCHAIIHLLLPFWQYPHPDQPPKWNWCSICGYQHKGIWRYIWGFARAQGSCRMPACQSQARAWSQSSDWPICSHNKGRRHKHSWKEVPWDNVFPSHCPAQNSRPDADGQLSCSAWQHLTKHRDSSVSQSSRSEERSGHVSVGHL